MRLIFVRHAQSVGNAGGLLQGRAEYELSEMGRQQAELLHARFLGEGFEPSHVYSSPQSRAAQTAEVVSRSWGRPISYWDELMEHDMGVFSGHTWAEISQKFPDMASEFQFNRDWQVVEGAETSHERRARGQRVVDTILSRHANDDVVLMFTHGGIMGHILAALMGTNRTWGLGAQNTALFDLSVDAERWWRNDDATYNNTELWRVNRFNDSSHLAQLG